MVPLYQSSVFQPLSKPQLLLCAPKIAGLLPARVPSRPIRTLMPDQEFIPKSSFDEWRIPTIAEMDAEIEEQLRAFRAARTAGYRESNAARRPSPVLEVQP